MQLTFQPKYHSNTNSYKNRQNKDFNISSLNGISFKGKDDTPRNYEKMVEEARKRYPLIGKDIWISNIPYSQRIARNEDSEKLQQAKNEVKQKLQNEIDFSNNFISLKGLRKIVGYKEQKDALINHVGIPIVLEKNGQAAKVPGGILLFGPLGTGKTTLVSAFADQLDCNLVNIQPTLDPKEDFYNLKKATKQAQQRFEKDKTRTIIKIDSFEAFGAKASKLIGALKGFMDDVSEKYHCTVFATTNNPEDTDRILLKRFQGIGLPPANKEDTTAILKHYAHPFVNPEVNYDTLAEEIVKVQPNMAFSNFRIKNIVQTIVVDNGLDRKISQIDLLKSIKEKGPDITKQMLDLFKKQVEFIKYI